MISSTDIAYQSIKQAILNNEFAPGEHLREMALAKEFGVSRTPLREAFNRLASEGWVEHIPNQGVRVTTWSLKDVQDIFAIRLQLEPYATRCAALRLDEEHIERLYGYAVDVRTYTFDQSDEAVSLRVQANNNFHTMLLSAADNPRLANILNSLVELPLVSWTFRAFSTEEAQRSIAHHFEIVQAIQARDPEWADAVMRAHILAARHAALQRLESHTSPPLT